MANNSLAGGYKDGFPIVSSIICGRIECKAWANENFVYIPMYDSNIGAFYFEVDKKLFSNTCEEEI